MLVILSNNPIGDAGCCCCCCSLSSSGAVWTQNPGNARGSPEPRGSPSIVRSFAVQLPPSGQSKQD